LTTAAISGRPAPDAEAFAVTAAACARLGWDFRRAGEIDPVPGSNVRWLARYRHPRCAGRARLVLRHPNPVIDPDSRTASHRNVRPKD
jgi:hypothetical protein